MILLAAALTLAQDPVSRLASLRTAFSDPVQSQPVYCLGLKLAECISGLKTRYQGLSGDYNSAIQSWNRVDVSGHAVRGVESVHLTFELPASGKAARFGSMVLHLDLEGKVWNIEFNFDGDDLGHAATSTEYDKTALYERLSPIIPENCDFKDRLALYRFFNDKVKPTISGPERDTYAGVQGAGDSYQVRSKRVSFCGSFIDYRQNWGRSTSYMSSGNPSGSFGTASLIVWSVPSL